MAELVGTTVGVVGLLGQLFSGCVKAYGFFNTATQMDGESKKLLCKVRIEEMRLIVWGREWGVAEGKLEAHLDGCERSNPQLRALATQILQELHGTVTDFRKLKETYGLGDGDGDEERGGGKGGKASSSPLDKRSHSSSSSDDKRKGKTKSPMSDRGWRREFALRSKWVIAGESFNVLRGKRHTDCVYRQG